MANDTLAPRIRSGIRSQRVPPPTQPPQPADTGQPRPQRAPGFFRGWRHGTPPPAHLSERLDRLSQRVSDESNGLLASTKGQALTVAAVFVAALAVQAAFPAAADAIMAADTNTAIQFFSALSQGLAALIGFFVGFLLFSMQGMAQGRNEAFRTFREQVEKLLTLSRERPPGSEEYDRDIARVVERLWSVKLEDFPLSAETWSGMGSFVERAFDASGHLGHPENIYLRQIGLTLLDLETAVNTIGLAYIGTMVTSLLLRSMSRLTALFGLSLILIVVFGSIDPGGVLPDLRRPTVVAVAAWLLLGLRDLLWWSRTMYRDFKSPWDEISD